MQAQVTPLKTPPPAVAPKPAAAPPHCRRIAVLGLGSIGLRHAQNLVALGHQVTGFDPDPARRAAAGALGAAIASERQAALDGAEAAIIASPNAQHLDDLRTCIARGLDVLVEKPIAHTELGLAETLDEAARRDLVVYNGYMLRHHPAIMAAREMLRDGVIGRPLWGRFLCASWLPGWRPNRDYRQGYAAAAVGGGALLDHIHEFDLAHLLLGAATILAASATRTGLLDLAGEDLADVQLAHEGGARSAVHVDYVTRAPIRQVDLSGETGRLWIDLNGRRLLRYDGDGRLAAEHSFNGSYAEDYVTEMRDFLRTVETRTSLANDGATALAVLRLVLQARRMAGFSS